MNPRRRLMLKTRARRKQEAVTATPAPVQGAPVPVEEVAPAVEATPAPAPKKAATAAPKKAAKASTKRSKKASS
jgi:hypothetical protein